jgi:hypothetical protein
VFVEQSTDGDQDYPVRVVVAILRNGLEMAVQRWPHATARAVHAALGELLCELDADESGRTCSC